MTKSAIDTDRCQQLFACVPVSIFTADLRHMHETLQKNLQDHRLSFWSAAGLQKKKNTSTPAL